MRFSSTSRPASSPGRADNPALLMRFLRTNIGSRSRGRSRSRKPIFFRRKNTTAATETQEPSSPKVTCMGQVRINRSKKPKPRVAGESRRRCGWVKNAFSCHPFTGKTKPTCFNPVWRTWKSFSNVSLSRKSEKRSSSSRSEPIFGRSTVEPEEPEEIRRDVRQEEEETTCDKSFTATPPRNALLLTRCRSAPYRSPSLANNLWEEQSTETKEPQDDDNDVIDSSESVLVPGETEDSRREEAKRSVLESTRREQCLVLRRCNSEPATIGEKLVPDNPRLGFT